MNAEQYYLDRILTLEARVRELEEVAREIQGDDVVMRNMPIMLDRRLAALVPPTRRPT